MGLGFRVWGLGFGVWGLGFRVWGLGFGVWGLGLHKYAVHSWTWETTATNSCMQEDDYSILSLTTIITTKIAIITTNVTFVTSATSLRSLRTGSN